MRSIITRGPAAPLRDIRARPWRAVRPAFREAASLSGAAPQPEPDPASRPGTGSRAARPRAVVIGGGIGGLTAAAALYGIGWQVTVLERSATVASVGSAISLAPNAQRALDVIGLGDEIRALAAWQGDGGLRTPGGRWLSRTSTEAARRAFGGSVVLLPRATLVDRLAAQLPAGCIRAANWPTRAPPAGRP